MHVVFSVENWDLFEKMLDHIYGHGLGAQSEFHPALFTEPAVCHIQLLYMQYYNYFIENHT